jgi:cation/acetate symporter
MIIAYTIPAVFISFMLTGNPIPQLGLGSEMADGTYLLDKLDQVVTQLGFSEYTTQARLSTTNMFVYTLSLMIGKKSRKCHANTFHLTNNISH